MLAEVTSLLFDVWVVFCWLFLVLLVFLEFPGFCGSFSIVLSVDLLFILVLLDFLTVEVVLPFLRHFPSCGVSARWERFAQCSFRHLGQVVFHLVGSLGVFLRFAAPDQGGC